jgi:hypothetical protein
VWLVAFYVTLKVYVCLGRVERMHSRVGSEVLVVQRCAVCVFVDGGRVEMEVNTISRVICMLVKSLATSFSTGSGDKV